MACLSRDWLCLDMAAMLRGRGMSGPSRRLHWEDPRSPKELASHEGWNGGTRRMQLKEHERIHLGTLKLQLESWMKLARSKYNCTRYIEILQLLKQMWPDLEVSFQTKSVPQPGCKMMQGHARSMVWRLTFWALGWQDSLRSPAGWHYLDFSCEAFACPKFGYRQDLSRHFKTT